MTARKNKTVDPVEAEVKDPQYVFILSGGIGAGKTVIVDRLKADFHFVVGSPADILKRDLAHVIAEQYGTPDDWEQFYEAMLSQDTKAEFRLLLQAYGEFFSNRDGYFWANQCVEAAESEYRTLAAAGLPSGIIFDSIRRPTEVLAIKARWPEAKHIRLFITPERQWDYLTNILGYSEELAVKTREHSSEHWLDDMDGTDYDAQYVIDANGDDNKTWVQLMGIIVLQMDGPTLEVAAAITEDTNG